MPAPLPGPRGAAPSGCGRARSPCSGQTSRQPQELRELLAEAAPNSPSPGHSAFSAGPSPPLLPSLPPSRGGKEGSPSPSSQRPEEARPSVSSALRFPGARTVFAPFPEPGDSSPRRAGATRPVSSSLKPLLLPPPPASPPTPASAGSRSPPLGELQTRKQLPQPSPAGASRCQAPSSPKRCAGFRAFRAPGAWRTAPPALRWVRGGAHAAGEPRFRPLVLVYARSVLLGVWRYAAG